MRVLLKAFKALGNETRLKLLATLLRKGEMTVTQLARQLGMSHSRVSRNLGILETNRKTNSIDETKSLHFTKEQNPIPLPPRRKAFGFQRGRTASYGAGVLW